MQNSKALRDFLVPVLVLLVGTGLIAATGFDLLVERHFYDQVGGWVGKNFFPVTILYRFGFYPAFIVGGVALVVFFYSFITPRALCYRKGALFLVLLLVLGPGLLVNSYFKDHWGRPRPAHLQMFGGTERMPYHQIWERGVAGQGKSFPSGHAAAAFYLFAPYFVLRRRAPEKARRYLALGLIYGVFMGIARMSQGGHFPSDVLWAGGITYLVGVVLTHLLKLDEEPDPQLETLP
ncbi:phosphatase PAP2 family protein [Geomesophilobacter sediminis]|uniref:Phosphatase PAP2 family protein n=1 Tax=Geomesophilobacter sediminis TaxID=2798584 RepID=A0A8J7LZ67_9BACT|nr:phosphatase PAP2 family protein [Geomesophilobacter sediminis]MBJ6725956.1 phosphatase PAP2 family protein [Geomesophilobacter sediminis]